MKRIGVLTLVPLGLDLLAAFGLAQQPADIKVFICADMEGVAGVVSNRQTGAEGADYGVFRSYMTAEVNAAVGAAFDSGATEVVVTDAHGGGTNLLAGELDRRAVLISGFPMPGGMMTGLDSSFAAAILIGAHGHGSAAFGVLAHTYTNALKRVRLNGIEVGEVGLNTAMAGHYGVPVVLVSGDQTVASEAHSLVSQIEAVVVKEGIGRTAARILNPETARSRIAAGVRSALDRRREIPPWKLQTPVSLEVELASTADADSVMLLPGMERLDGRTVRYSAPDMATAYRISILVERLASD